MWKMGLEEIHTSVNTDRKGLFSTSSTSVTNFLKTFAN